MKITVEEALNRAAISRQDFAYLFGMGFSTVVKMTLTGEIPSFKVGVKSVRIPRSYYEKLIKETK